MKMKMRKPLQRFLMIALLGIGLAGLMGCGGTKEEAEQKEIAGAADLEGARIGVQLGTTGDIYAEDVKDAKVEKYNKGADAVLALVGGDIDAVIIDNQPAKVFVEQNAGLEILPTEYAVEEYAIAVKKGNTELLDQINGALEALIADGTVDAIVAKYISAN